MELKVGDKVEIMDNGHMFSTYRDWVLKYAPKYKERFGVKSRLENGEIGEIIAVGKHLVRDIELYLVYTGSFAPIPNTLGLISGEGIQKIEGDDEVVEFKVGDKVKIVGSEGFECEFKDNIGIIKQIDGEETNYPVLVEFDSKSWDWGHFDDLELVHNYLKKGTRVEVIGDESGHHYEIGEIVTLVKLEGDGVHAFINNDNDIWYMDTTDYKIYTPKKTFKIEQVIEMMREDNSRKFQSAIDSEGDYIQIEGEQIVWRGHKQSGQVFKLGLLDDLWVEYDEIEPKTFQEVLEEVNNTPDIILIKMEHRFKDLDYQDLEDMLHDMAEIWFSDDISKVLLEGKFYTKIK